MVLTFWRLRLHSWLQTGGEMHQQKATCDELGRSQYLDTMLPTLFLPKRCRVELGNFANNFWIVPAFPSILQSLRVILVLPCLARQVLWRGKETSLTTFRLHSVQSLNFVQIHGHCGWTWPCVCVCWHCCLQSVTFGTVYSNSLEESAQETPRNKRRKLNTWSQI